MANFQKREIESLMQQSDELLSGIDLTMYETKAEKEAREYKELMAIREETRREIEAMERAKTEAAMENHVVQEGEAPYDRKGSEEIREAIGEGTERASEIEQAVQEASEERYGDREAEGETATQTRETAEILSEAFAGPSKAGQAKAESHRKAKKSERTKEKAAPKRSRIKDSDPSSHRKAKSVAKEEDGSSGTSGSIDHEGRLIPKSKEPWSILLVILGVLYMEGICHGFLFGTAGLSFLPIKMLFLLGGSCLLAVVLHLFEDQVNRILTMVVFLAFGLYFDLQMLHLHAFSRLLEFDHFGESLSELFVSASFLKEAATGIMPGLVLMFLPLVLWAVCFKRISFARKPLYMYLMGAVLGLFLLVGSVFALDRFGYEARDPYVVFYQYDNFANSSEAVCDFGLLPSTVLELRESIVR